MLSSSKNVDEDAISLERREFKNDEDFLIYCSKKPQDKKNVQIFVSKSWLLTAKTLYPHEVSIHVSNDAFGALCILFIYFGMLVA